MLKWIVVDAGHECVDLASGEVVGSVEWSDGENGWRVRDGRGRSHWSGGWFFYRSQAMAEVESWLEGA